MAASLGSTISGAVQMTHAALIWTMERHGDFSLSNGGGPLDEYFRERFDGPAAGESEDYEDELLSQYAEAAERRREDRERWQNDRHTLGHVTMTGKEWEAFADELKSDTPLRRWLLQEIMRRENKTEAEAKKQADEIALLARMQSMPEEDWTPEMKALDRKLDEQPELRAKYVEYTEDVKAYKDQNHGLKNANESTIRDSSQDQSVEVAADVLAATPDTALPYNRKLPASAAATRDMKYEVFPTAPVLVEHHAAAMAATEPLDSKPLALPREPSPPRTSPGTQVASASPGAGFDS